MDVPPTLHARRVALIAAVPVVVIVGLAARFGLGGAPADWAGGVLYTALVYVLVALARPADARARVALTALAISVAVELFQLTPVPERLADAVPPVRLVLGSSFAAADLAAYALGALLAPLADRVLTRFVVR